MKGVSARKVLCTARRHRRPGSPEFRFHEYLYQGVYTSGEGEPKPCGDGACFHEKRGAATRCAVHTARRAQEAH